MEASPPRACWGVRVSPVDVDTQKLAHALGCTLAWNWQVLPVPHAHADTRHTLADTMPRPSQGRTPGQPEGDWKFQSGLGSTNTVWRRLSRAAAGWGSAVANGVVGSPPYPAWLCASVPLP